MVHLAARPFEDTIDGYFPLHVSLAQMLARCGFAAALVHIKYAPIMDFPGLPDTAPVPLSVSTGFAGILDCATFCVTPETLSGVGRWRWLSANVAGAARFGALTRLAEPCFVTGLGLLPGEEKTVLFGAVAMAQNGGLSIAAKLPADLQKSARVWRPFKHNEIAFSQGDAKPLPNATDGTYVIEHGAHMP